MAQYNINLYQFNNYSDRILKRELTLEDYGDPVAQVEATNFNFADGVETAHVIDGLYEIPDCNYAVVYEAPDTIVSRWFVMDNPYISNRKFRVILHRDVVADSWDNILDEPMFIEKATLDDTDPMIFNREDFSVNQIKKNQWLLKDTTQSPWIIGYLANDMDSTISVTIPNSKYGNILHNYDQIRGYVDNPVKVLKGVNIVEGISKGSSGRSGFICDYTLTKTDLTRAVQIADWSNRRTTRAYVNKDSDDLYLRNATLYFNRLKEDRESLIELFNNNLGTVTEDNVSQYNNRIVDRIESGVTKYYRIQVTEEEVTPEATTQNFDGGFSRAIVKPIQPEDDRFHTKEINDFMEARLATYGGTVSGSPGYHKGFSYTYTRYTVTLQEMTLDGYHYDLPTTTKALSDAPYRMFALKYKGLIDLKIAMETARTLGSNLFDIQILPYCPVPELNVGVLIENEDYVKIRNGTSVYDYLYFCEKSEFHFEIPFEINVTEPKVENQCDTYRLCCPNGSGCFEFSAAQNGGVHYFNVDCYYKPYNPYIRMAPDFGGLYGSEYKDYRGLIFQGDFSIPRVNDAWAEYEIQNKNYQTIFNRQIQNMKVNNNYQRFNDITNMLGSAIGGGFSAAGATGIMSMGNIGLSAAVGAGAAGASLIGGIVDTVMKEKLRQETLDYTKDMYSYNLQNIQALPDTVAKTGCLSPNNPLFPYLEYYTCTDTEKEAFRNKIKYNGMTVMRIGTIREFLKNDYTYIKGKLIRADNLQVDNHYIEALKEELNKGVFCK